MRKEKKSFLCLIGVAFLIYLILDYFNCPKLIGFDFTNINSDLFGVVVNSLVVILLYIITYFEIDKRQLRKDENAQKTACVLLIRTYNLCLNIIEQLDNKIALKNYIIPKMDSCKTVQENPILLNIKNIPFDTFENILNLSENGHMDTERFNSYLWIKDKYGDYIQNRILFFDLELIPLNHEQEQLKNIIGTSKKELLNKIQEEIAFIEKMIKPME